MNPRLQAVMDALDKWWYAYGSPAEAEHELKLLFERLFTYDQAVGDDLLDDPDEDA